MTNLEAILLARIEPDTNGWGCWLWSGSVGSHGYGDLRFESEHHLVHRVAFRLWVGPIPEDKPHVCHRCDVRPCIRPDHLFAGDDTDNHSDAARKGRQPHVTLRAADIPLIRARLATGEILRTIAASYGVSITAIWSIKTGATWRHVN